MMKKETIAIVISFILLAGIITFGMLNSKENTLSGPKEETQPEKKGKFIILDKEPLTETSLHHLDTTDWLTYKGEEGFSFKYPPNEAGVTKGEIKYGPACLTPEGKILEKCGNAELKAKYFIFDVYRRAPYYGATFLINVWENTENLSLRDWAGKTGNPIGSLICISLSINNSTDGLACKDAGLNPLPGGIIFYDFYLSHKDLIYIFSFFEMGCPPSDPKCELLQQQQIYETIISTFSVE